MTETLSEQALERVKQEWLEASARFSAWLDWRQAHPRESFSSADDFHAAQRDHRRAIGMNDYGHHEMRCYGDWRALQLRTPTAWGDWVIQCMDCRTLQIQSSSHKGNGRCQSCRDKELQARAARKAAQRIEKRKERSAALASRRGLCLVCRTPITVARTTRRTCSDRCRKQLLRNPERYELPPATTTVMIDDAVLSLDQALARLADHAIKAAMLRSHPAAAMIGQPSEVERLIEADRQAVQRLKDLARLREEAPAVFLAEVSQ